jgi:hypothetical protein
MAVNRARLTTIISCVLISVFLLISFAWLILRPLYVTPEDYSEPADLLTYDELKIIESFIGMSFPDETQKIYSHLDDFDVAHLYLRVDIKAESIPEYMKEINWISPENWEELLTEPVYRRFFNSWVIKKDKTLGWWKPDKNHILGVHRESTKEGGNKVSDITIFLEKTEQGEHRLYIAQNFYWRAPQEIKNIFPDKPNWNLRESKQNPMIQAITAPDIDMGKK